MMKYEIYNSESSCKRFSIYSTFLFTGLFVFCFPVVTFGADYLGSGFNDVRLNDCFIGSSSPSVGSASWDNSAGDYHLVHSSSDNYIRSSNLSTWTDPYNGPPPSVEYYMSGLNPSSGTWQDNGGGAPVGSFSLTTCGASGGGSSTTSMATTSLDKTADITYNGFILFIIGLVLPLWIYKRR